MKTSLLSAALILTITGVVAAQSPDRYISPITTAGLRDYQRAPSRHPVFSRPVVRTLRLRGNVEPTGLTGFYDYQSNGASPGYIATHPTNPLIMATTAMVSGDGSSIEAANDARTVGYAYTVDGGLTWASAPSIFELRLGFPHIQIAPSGIPYIAAHGDLGEGDRAFLFGTGELSGSANFFPLSELPLLTESGRAGGVAWPAFVVARDGSRAVVLGSYSNEIDDPEAPLQVASVMLSSGETQERWRNLADSVVSASSGGRSVIARSASGVIGAAWFKFPLDSTDATWGVYYASSGDDGATWSSPVPVLAGEQLIEDFNINDDVDTISAGANLDLAFRGDEPQLVFTGNLNELLQFANVLFWSPSTGLRMVAMSHQEPGLGAFSVPLEKRQSNMGSIAYPTVSVGDDGRHVVVAFSAMSQTLDEFGDLVDDAVSPDGFQYYRLWGVGSADGGRNWGRPFVIQDLAEKATDSASIEYPAAAEIAPVAEGSLELPVVFQAKRYPGMYIYTGEGDDASDVGPITEATQYFQRFTVTPAMFRSISSAPREELAALTAGIYPNTTATSAVLDIELPAASNVDVRIVDVLGREMAHPVVDATVEAGRHRFDLNVTALPAGQYHCVVRHDDGVVTKRLDVAR